MMMPLALPLALWLVRWMCNHLCALRHPYRQAHPLVQLLPQAGRKIVRSRLIKIALDGRILLGALALATLCMIVDMKPLGVIYGKTFLEMSLEKSDCPSEIDWTVYTFSQQPRQTGYVSPVKNFGLVLIAYPDQYLLIIFGMFMILTILRHNLMYLRTIFRRSIAESHDPDQYLAVNFDDGNRCFGLKPLHKPFNAQLIFLTISGAIILVSRFVNVPPLDSETFETIPDALQQIKEGVIAFAEAMAKIPYDKLFPDAGQIMLAMGWVCCLLAVTLPAFLKFLPCLNKQIRSAGITQFLLEFMKKDDPLAKEPMPSEVCDALGKKFAQNSFWPTGDRPARILFYVVFLALFLILFPVLPAHLHVVIQIGYYVFLCILSVAITNLFFLALRFALSHVDERLVKPPKGE